MRYYLLTFNEDWADEHNVPALACFTEDEFEKWKKTPSGILNKNYEQELENYDAFQEAKEEQEERFRIEIGENWGRVQFDRWPILLRQEYDALHERFGYRNRWAAQQPYRLTESGIRANLGNSGDGFDQNFRHLYLMEEFIEADYVKVKEVDENFYNTFKEAGLADLSLTNIFTCNFYFDEEDEDLEDIGFNTDEW